MNSHQKKSNMAGIFIAAFIGMSLALFETSYDKLFAANIPHVQLGSVQECNAYQGLPEGFGGKEKNSQHHPGMVEIRGGEFTPGTTQGYADERPAGKVVVKNFWIDQTEVTVAQFSEFVKATHYKTDAEREGGAAVFHKPSEAELSVRPYAWWSFVKGANWKYPQGSGKSEAVAHHPVTLVTQKDALAYAQWLGNDLPTEIEWEFAAKAGRDGAELEKAPYDATGKPGANYWQGTFPLINTDEDGFDGLAPVGCFAANKFKIYDTIANVWEWTKDEYTGPHQPHLNGDTSQATAPARSPSPDQRVVIKGGSYLCAHNFCARYRASAREAQEAGLGTSHIGFRTVRRS